MSDEAAETEEGDDAPKKASKMPLIIGLVLLLAGGGGGFFAVQSGMLGGSAETHADAAPAEEDTGPKELNVTFVPIDPLIISLPGAGARGHLRFVTQLEVAPAYVAEVEALKPRIVDVLNGYLRAVDLSDLEDPTALMRLRSQMLRRVQVVTGSGRVSDLLIMEFVLS